MPRVAIIGGGIGGLTAANALSQAGIEVAVYEAAAELKEIGAGVALHANAMRVLRAIGVEDGVRKVAGRSEWAVTRNGKTGRVISKTSRKQQAAAFGVQSATVHRADLLDVLADALPPGLVTLGKRCTRVEPDGATAVARFADGSEIEADVIIGADGIHSAVRTSLFGPDDPRFTGKICYRSVIPTAAVSGSSPSADNGQWLGPHGTIVLYPLRGEELINVVCHYDDDGYRHESWITECSREEVLERYAGWHESLLRLFAAGNTWYKWALYDRDPIPRWTRGRRHAARRRRAPDAALPRAGRLPGARGRRGAGHRAHRGGRRPAHRAGQVRGHPAAEGEPGGAHRARAGAEQPPGVAMGDHAAGSADRGAAAAQPARPGRPRRGLARRVRRDLARRARCPVGPGCPGEAGSATGR